MKHTANKIPFFKNWIFISHAIEHFHDILFHTKIGEKRLNVILSSALDMLCDSRVSSPPDDRVASYVWARCFIK